MDPFRNALWYVETHLAEPISLDGIARAGGLSRFHFSRGFVRATGWTVSAYLRGRRLTEAARRLVEGAPDILSVALDAGYGSHEAFTRAFREQFGVTPENVRAGGVLEHLALVEPFIMSEQPKIDLAAPEFREEGPLLLVGLKEFRGFADRAATIPGQWQRFAPHIGNVPGQIGRDTFGACLSPTDGGDGFDYVTAVAVRSLDEIPGGLIGLRLARARYAVFAHRTHVSTIAATCDGIFRQWFPTSGFRPTEEPCALLEHYGPGFDPETGLGEISVWVPLAG